MRSQRSSSGTAAATLEQALVALPEGEEQAPILVGEVAGERPLERPEDRLALRLGPDQDERVVRDADEGRRQHGQERLVVVAVVQEPQVREQVDDLLLPEVVPSGGAVGREADGAELLLEPLGVGAGGEEEDDLARGRIARRRRARGRAARRAAPRTDASGRPSRRRPPCP